MVDGSGAASSEKRENPDQVDVVRPKLADSGWRTWTSHNGLRAVLAFVVAAAVATVVGVVSLWPTGEGIDSAMASAAEIGLVTDRYLATVQEIRDGPCAYSTADSLHYCRQVTVVLEEGPEPGRVIALPEFDLEFVTMASQLRVDQKIVLGYEPSTDYYFYADTDRRSPLAWLGGLFALFVVALGRWRGVFALVGMVATLVILIGFMAPSVLDGHDPLLVAVVAAAAVAFVTMYLAHGLNQVTTVALAGTLSALVLTLGFSWVFFELAAFTGLASDEALVLPLISGGLDVASLILGGAIIGALGALDDVTVTQASLVAELHYRNPLLGTRELVMSGLRVGREHIASTVNTLLLAYVGAGIPLVMLFAVSNQSLVMVANSELIAVELVRTLCGSLGLVAAVPITTLLAALVKAGPRKPMVEPAAEPYSPHSGPT